MGSERDPSVAFDVPKADLWAARQACDMYEAHQLSGTSCSLVTFESLPFLRLRERINMPMHMLEEVLDPSQGVTVEAGHVCYARILTKTSVMDINMPEVA